jgi:alkanesulfonate monooxygenase SsuD/methylene tetrahydromethanopterin reductase-like flavin-dependent oxidoreductase (luciferase family)
MAEQEKLALYGLHRGSSADPDTLVRRARLAEEAGFEGLRVGDHVALPAGLPDPPDRPRLEALVALTYMAAVTTRVRLGLGVIMLPQRQPVLLAKQLTSIDVLSKGRLTVGVGSAMSRRSCARWGRRWPIVARGPTSTWRPCGRCWTSPHPPSRGGTSPSPA